MNILKSYEKDLKSYDELKNEIEKIENKDDVNIIDKLATIYYYINIYDKYYNIEATILKKENTKTKKIIDLYSMFELKQTNIIINLLTKIDINDIDKHYKIYIEDAIKNSNKTNEYEILYQKSEEIFNSVFKNEMNLNDKIGYLKKYVELKEQMAHILGYSSFLDYKINELGISKDIFIYLINLDIEKIKIKDDVVKKYYSLNETFKIIQNISDKYLNKNIIEKLCNNIILNSKSFVLNSYKKEPAIFINFNNDLESVDRLFHEISHAYHYIIASDNNLIDYSPNQFISEMFSMFNEIILLNEIDDVEKTNVFNSLFNNFFIDAINSLKLEYFVHQNYNVINIDLLKDFDIDFEKHINFIFNDYYDINYAIGFIIAILLANKFINKEIDIKLLEKMLKENERVEISKILNIVGIEINNMELYDNFFNTLNCFDRSKKENKM